MKEKGAIEKVTYGAEVPTINQVYEISRKTSKSSQEPFKTLIDKQQKHGFTCDNIMQRIQAKLFHATSFHSMTACEFFKRIFVAQITLAITLH